MMGVTPGGGEGSKVTLSDRSFKVFINKLIMMPHCEPGGTRLKGVEQSGSPRASSLTTGHLMPDLGRPARGIGGGAARKGY